MSEYTILVEPRSERNGLFPEEQSLKLAIKELNNKSLSFKRSTRGYTALFENKDINPMLAGKHKKEREALVHEIHCRYVKFLAIRDFKKSGFILETTHDETEQYEVVFKNEQEDSEIKIVCEKEKWMIHIMVTGIPPSSPPKFLLAYQARIGKNMLKND